MASVGRPSTTGPSRVDLIVGLSFRVDVMVLLAPLPYLKVMPMAAFLSI